MENLYEMCRSRSISEDVIQKLQEDKIDENAIRVMSDDQLRPYIPHFGDRICILNFCCNKSTAPDNKKVQNVNDTLFLKLKQHVASTGTARIRCQKVTTTAKSNVDEGIKPVHFGLKKYGCDKTKKDFCYIQVKADQGGGSRKSVLLNRSALKIDLIKCAQKLYFHPKTVLGAIDEFKCDIRDFAGSKFEDNVSLGNFYDETRLRPLRFYLYIKGKEFGSTELDVGSTKKQRVKKRKLDQVMELESSSDDCKPDQRSDSSNTAKIKCTCSSADSNSNSPEKRNMMKMCEKCGRIFAGKALFVVHI